MPGTFRQAAAREYQDAVVSRAGQARIAIEQASTLGWDGYVGDGGVVGIQTCGASAALNQLLTNFGSTPEPVAKVSRERVAAGRECA